MRTTFALPLALLVVACSDYDLHRPEKGSDPVIDTGEIPPPEENPDLAISPNPIDFGSVLKDCPADPIEVTITNEGLADLEVTGFSLEGDGTSAFELTPEPVTLAYRESYSFAVNFTPGAWLDYELQLQVQSNDPDGRTDVPVLGTGASGALYEESFDQTFHDEVDVLWIVDNSCSMTEEQDEVAYNFEHFINEFLDLGLDYHLAVVTTDMDDGTQSGRIQGSVITTDSADPEAEFIEAVSVGAMGSGDERGFKAAHAALTEPLLSSANAGFWREDAGLSIIILSDEDDGDTFFDTWADPSDFADWAMSLKDDPTKVTFSGITGPEGLIEECDGVGATGATLNASGAPRYHQAIYETGGFAADICTSDYAEALQHVSLTGAGMRVFWELTQEPTDISHITVTVDGVEVPQSSSNGWTYDTSDNRITFHGTAIPDEGSHVVVSYYVAAECGR